MSQAVHADIVVRRHAPPVIQHVDVCQAASGAVAVRFDATGRVNGVGVVTTLTCGAAANINAPVKVPDQDTR